MKKGEWLPEEDAKLLALRAKGLSYDKIAERMGRFREAVRKRAMRIGVSRDRINRYWTPEEDAMLRKLYEHGYDMDEIGIRLNRHRTTCGVRRKILGLTRPKIETVVVKQQRNTTERAARIAAMRAATKARIHALTGTK